MPSDAGLSSLTTVWISRTPRARTSTSRASTVCTAMELRGRDRPRAADRAGEGVAAGRTTSGAHHFAPRVIPRPRPGPHPAAGWRLTRPRSGRPLISRRPRGEERDQRQRCQPQRHPLAWARRGGQQPQRGGGSRQQDHPHHRLARHGRRREHERPTRADTLPTWYGYVRCQGRKYQLPCWLWFHTAPAGTGPHRGQA